TVYNDLLLFIANDSTGSKIWRSDGTEEGTQILVDIEAADGFINANGTLFFTATDNERGLELWRTDGTPEGTHLVQDIFAGPNDSSPRLLDYINDALYFTALDESNGRELWALSPLRIQTELSTSSGVVCTTEDSITFTVSATNAGAKSTYRWYLNDQLVPDQSRSVYTAAGFTNGDEVRVQVIASKDVWVLNDSVFSETFTIDFAALKPSITLANNTLTASEGASYQWFLEGELLPETTQAITALQSGNYQVEITSASGCLARSEEVEVIVCTSNAPIGRRHHTYC
ncbi:MAG: ELWxxDGT repeat protein, partial [Bacteroidota bacterium]